MRLGSRWFRLLQEYNDEPWLHLISPLPVSDTTCSLSDWACFVTLETHHSRRIARNPAPSATSGRNIQGVLQTGEGFNTYTPETDNKALVGDLLENGVVLLETGLG